MAQPDKKKKFEQKKEREIDNTHMFDEEHNFFQHLARTCTKYILSSAI